MRCLRECGRDGCGLFTPCINTYMNAKQNTKPESQQDVCIGWGCSYRSKCKWDVEKGAVVIVRYFQPQHTGEHCEFYTEK